MNIYLEEGQAIDSELLAKMQEAGEFLLNKENTDAARTEISLTFVFPEEIRSLNSQYRAVDSVTDVLSFPQFESPGEFPETGEICLGDVVICKERAAEQAEEYGHSAERELVYLFVHSLLHLLGYDHMEEEEKKIMREKEEYVMEHVNLR